MVSRAALCAMILATASAAPGEPAVHVLTDANFDEKTQDGLWLLKFYAVRARTRARTRCRSSPRAGTASAPARASRLAAAGARCAVDAGRRCAQPWCGHCKALEPVLDAFAAEHKDKINVGA